MLMHRLSIRTAAEAQHPESVRLRWRLQRRRMDGCSPPGITAQAETVRHVCRHLSDVYGASRLPSPTVVQRINGRIGPSGGASGGMEAVNSADLKGAEGFYRSWSCPQTSELLIFYKLTIIDIPGAAPTTGTITHKLDHLSV